ncbi:RnfABCDGE type electron transport complex subunit B [Deferrisoma camini]|uniref:RnfABCDGE type electron transport complex subunit B n=1 Tax=Deferrisoma camini TaxID=1035120 RepID=UPI00046D83DE|nr:RnfABCDGE type electron transport complex subunit B [Deferrisoma camini]
MIPAVGVLGLLGLLAALGLAVASLRFRVEVDPRVEQIEGVLPGVNCGACGYAGCSALAQALVEGEAAPTACIPGGGDVAQAVAGILGVDAGETVQRVAVVHCKGSPDVAPDRGRYAGIPDCRAAALVGGGPKRCDYGCMGLGSCERACPFDAIHVGPDRLAHVDREKCTGCGACVEACPKRIIDLVPADRLVYIRCTNPHRGKAVKAVCSVGCIGCRRCEKTCPFGAISMDRDLARIDPEKCTSCGLCATVCPTSTIDDLVEVRHRARIDEDACIGCTKCAKVCPVDAIAGERKQPHRVDPEKCIACSQCMESCPVNAIHEGEPLVRGQGEAA